MEVIHITGIRNTIITFKELQGMVFGGTIYTDLEEFEINKDSFPYDFLEFESIAKERNNKVFITEITIDGIKRLVPLDRLTHLFFLKIFNEELKIDFNPNEKPFELVFITFDVDFNYSEINSRNILNTLKEKYSLSRFYFSSLFNPNDLAETDRDIMAFIKNEKKYIIETPESYKDKMNVCSETKTKESTSEKVKEKLSIWKKLLLKIKRFLFSI